MKAAVLAVGDELLEGRYPDLNSSAIAASLLQVGLHAGCFEVVADDEDLIARSLARLAAEHAVVLVTGGLGPTLDDVTRSAVARAAGVELVVDEAARRHVEGWWARTGRQMPESNERQMLVPAGAGVLPNPHGTAPGFRIELGECQVFAMPGPPREMQPMLEGHVLGWIDENLSSERVFAERRFHLFGISESLFADKAGEWMERGANPQMGVTFKAGTLTVRVVGWGADREAAEEIVERRAGAFRSRFGSVVYSESEGDPAVLLIDACRAKALRIALAESCTGGLVASRLTAIPGASDVLAEGFVTYSNGAKTARLGVSEELLDAHGAVSREVAEAMARGAVQASEADAAVAVTGIAGPDGGSADKPVGLVWFATCVADRVASEERRFPTGSRTRIQEWASTAALRLLTGALE